jgi:hypothetical protein
MKECFANPGQQEIEGKEHDPMRRLEDHRTQGIEIGYTIFVLDDKLAVDQGRLAGQLGGGIDHPAIGSGPIPAMAREGPYSALVDDYQRAIAAIMLDRVNPVLSGGWLRDQGRDLRWRKSRWAVITPAEERGGAGITRAFDRYYVAGPLRKDV